MRSFGIEPTKQLFDVIISQHTASSRNSALKQFSRFRWRTQTMASKDWLLVKVLSALPQWRGGGIIFGSLPRNYAYKLPQRSPSPKSFTQKSCWKHLRRWFSESIQSARCKSSAALTSILVLDSWKKRIRSSFRRNLSNVSCDCQIPDADIANGDKNIAQAAISKKIGVLA